MLSAHWRAISRYLEDNDPSELAKFEGKRFKGMELETRPDAIDELYNRGELDDFYADE